MGYSIKIVRHNKEDKDGKVKLYIQVIYNKMKVYLPTIFKTNGVISDQTNNIIKGDCNAIEKRLLDALQFKEVITKERLTEIVKNKRTTTLNVVDFTDQLIDELTGKYDKATLTHYKSIAKKINTYTPGIALNEITEKWLSDFEKHLRIKNSDNTVWTNFKFIRTILNAAIAKKLLDTTPFETYKMPKYIQHIPDYLTETEINKLSELVFSIEQPGHKLAGMYFLLSCYTGYRLGDAKRFNSSMISGNKIMLRAKKNGSVVSIPIHTKLKPVLAFVKKNPMTLSEQKIREYVKELCLLKGIKKKVKYHTSRHTFAMLLMDKGFTVDEVSELIGNSLLITKVYARITNESLSKKIMEKLK